MAAPDFTQLAMAAPDLMQLVYAIFPRLEEVISAAAFVMAPQSLRHA